MYHEFATDPKVQMLSEQDQRRYVMLLCLRCSNGDETLHETEVAFQLRISDDDWMQTKAVLMDKGLIDKSNKPCAWDKRQYISDCSTNRVKHWREKEKEKRNNNETLHKRSGSVSVTAPDTDTDTDTEKNKNHVADKSAPVASPEEKPKPKPKTLTSADLVALGVSQQVADDYMTLRKAKRLPLTKTALDQMLAEFAKSQITVDQGFITCVQRGWASFRSDWYIQQPSMPPGGQIQPVKPRLKEYVHQPSTGPRPSPEARKKLLAAVGIIRE
jgi:hypothetical protein